MELNKIQLYRMTHIQNIPHILQYGITHKNSPNRNSEYKDIGDGSLINNRNTKKKQVNNGNYNKKDCTAIVLGDFIPFYFDVKMPMLFVIQKGGNFVKNQTQPNEIIYLVCSLEKIVQSDFLFYFSDAHANDNFSSLYDKTQIDKINDILDWKAIKAPDWGGDGNMDTKHKKQAEFLLKNDLPPEYISKYGCFNELTKKQLIEMGIPAAQVKVNQNAYF